MGNNILFVDDDPHALSGLKKMLRAKRSVWNVALVPSAAAALEILEQNRIDIIVACYDQPGSPGSHLLDTVKSLYPHTVRIAMLDSQPRQSLGTSLPAAHQYLCKPCDAAVLLPTLENSLFVRQLLTDQSLRFLITQIDSLPSLPALYLEVINELNSPAASLNRVGEIIGQDIGMTAKILQLVNSAFFGLGRQVSSPAQAVGLLGLETVKILVLSVQVFTSAPRCPLAGLSVERLWEHSLATGLLARTLARNERLKPDVCEAAFMAGLLHDTGKLILAAHLPQIYTKVLSLQQESGCPLCDAEYQVVGVSHAEVGAYLLALWGLPRNIVEVVAYHHQPSQVNRPGLNPLSLVHVSNYLDHDQRGQGTSDCSHLDDDFLAQTNLAPQLPQWRAICAGGLPATP